MATKRGENVPAPAGLSRERVCGEALALVDAEGLEALSMRRLGARLGVEAMSLYRHVRNKADLLDALHAAVLGDLKPEGGDARDWRELLGGLARALRTTLLQHPHVLPLFTTRPVRAPEAVATVTRVQDAMAHAGFRPAEIEQAIYVVGMFTIGHAIFDAQGAHRAAERADDRRRAATFRFGLEALLDGIARAHRRPRRQSPIPRSHSS
jgi:TetR/AcrR family transcriptional regulator, tetracycline repressor protein